MNLRWSLSLLALSIASGAALATDANVEAARRAPQITRAALEDVTLLGLDGIQHRLAELDEGSALVLAYTGVGCPISGKYGPRLSRFREEYAERGVRFLGINANPQDTLDAIASDAQELGLTFPVFQDLRQELTRRLDAKTTTEVFVFDGEGDLRYRGAIDDQYTLGASKPKPTVNLLASALDAVLEGGAPAVTESDAPGCLITRITPEDMPEAVTYSGDIARILQNNCEVCHRPGQVGPFALQTYDQARGWAEMIASVVSEERMPPWNANERFDGHFINERRLTKSEKAKVAQWVADGMPRGNPDEDPAPREWSDGWRIGEPDVVFEMSHWLRSGEPLAEEGYRVPREGTVDYQHFTAQTSFAEDRWIQSMEIRSQATDVVHHVLIGAHDPKDGRFRGEQELINYLAVAVPGDTPSVFPEGYAKLLPAGATLIFQLHYTTNGKERFDRSSIGMIFAEEPPIFAVRSEAILNQSFEIPPGAEDFEVRTETRLNEEVGLISYFPHMHQRGTDFQYIAHYPDGSDEELLFSDYDFNWQESYVYPDPKLLPAGTVIECIAHYDNSAKNPNNPDPTQAVHWGDQTWEEMFVGYYDHVIPLD